MTSTVRPLHALRALLTLVLVVAVASAALTVTAALVEAPPFDGFGRLRLLMDVNEESNVPTWLATGLLLTAALLMWGTARAVAGSGGRWHRHWLLLSAVFAYLSLDELAGLHELANPVVDDLLDTGGILTFGWVVVAAPLVVLFALLLVPFLRALPRRTASLMVLAGALYVTGALGVELVGAQLFSTTGPDTVAYALATSVEELLELLGTSVLLVTVLEHQQRFVSARQAVYDSVA